MDIPIRAGEERPLTIAELEQWAAFGARWRPHRIGEGQAIVDLCQCTGELVERRTVVDPEVLAYVRAHVADADADAADAADDAG
jgi:hypothetical protein